MSDLKVTYSVLSIWIILNLIISKSIALNISTLILEDSIGIHINDSNQITVHLSKGHGEHHILHLGQQIPLSGVPKWTVGPKQFKAAWGNGIQLRLFAKEEKSGTKLLKIKWTAPKNILTLQQCIDFGSYNWYGGTENVYQAWPLQSANLPKVPYVPGYPIDGAVMAPYFLSSASISYFGQPTNPLFVSIGTEIPNALCLTAEFKRPYRNTNGRQLILDIDTTWNDPPNMLELWKSNSLTHFGYPSAIPSMKMAHDPIWSSWVSFKADINQTSFLEFTEEVKNRGFPVSQMELDDNWETCYGDEKFDPVKFPDPTDMVTQIKNLGFDVTLWIHPFVNSDCQMYAEGDGAGYFVTINGTNVTGRTNWWNGISAGIIDITNPSAAEWWELRLRNLSSQTGINSFKFDAGESSYLPKDAYLSSSDESVQPGSYTNYYSNFARKFGNQVECRVGYFAQSQGGIYQRILDRDSIWGLDNGLHSVITTTLEFGIIGYPFVLPDYIGGNAYGIYPSKELYIRWVQLTAFLPVMQFSILPWSYDDEVSNISLNMIYLHQNIFHVIEAAANQSLIDGSPIIRPIWWLDWTDTTAQSVNDEFLVGSTYLVAPIVEKSSYSRDIYLPNGSWIDILRGTDITGPVWLYNYTVELNEISYFQNKNP
ncbi:hypothetical protein CHUAL_011307 [Chamberlinius hualienensis]